MLGLLPEGPAVRFIHPNDLPISVELKVFLQLWDETYQITFDHTNPSNSGFASPVLEAMHHERGKELAARLQQELGDDYLVEYKV